VALQPLLKRAAQFVRARGRANSAIFDEIYRKNFWGGEGVYSGQGSDQANTAEYERLVADYAIEHGIRSIVDIGCGDFQVSERILARLPESVTYRGLDVSSVAVERNSALFASERVSFAQCDAAGDELPAGDLVLVREVLQHLSNRDILAILPKLRRFPHAIVTNTRRKGARPRNADQASGASSRVATCGGLWLELPPFGQPIEELLVVEHAFFPTEIVTVKLA
jgi:SAM-dependent methyltransferase